MAVPIRGLCDLLTECTPTAIEFTRVKRRQVVANFDGGRLTSDAGVALLREVDRRIGLLDAIDACLPDPRDPRYITREQREMLAQRIFSLALGYEDLNDQRSMYDFLANQFRLLLHLASSYPYQNLFRQVAAGLVPALS